MAVARIRIHDYDLDDVYAIPINRRLATEGFSTLRHLQNAAQYALSLYSPIDTRDGVMARHLWIDHNKTPGA